MEEAEEWGDARAVHFLIICNSLLGNNFITFHVTSAIRFHEILDWRSKSGWHITRLDADLYLIRWKFQKGKFANSNLLMWFTGANLWIIN